MMSMRGVLLASFLLLGACGGGNKSAAQEPAPTTDGAALSNTQPAAAPAQEPASPNAVAMAKMEQFAGQMCACKDADCAKRVADDMTKWAQQMAQETKEPVKMTEDEMKRATEIGTRMGECMQTAMGAGPTNP